MDFEIRPARLEDAETVVEFWAAAAHGETVTDNAAAVRLLIRRDPEALAVAVDPDGRLVGTLITGFDGWRGALYRMAVHPEWRRRGVAGALLLAAEDRLRSLGCVRLTGMVTESNDGGRAFWAASGFRRDDSNRRWVKTLDA